MHRDNPSDLQPEPIFSESPLADIFQGVLNEFQDQYVPDPNNYPTVIKEFPISAIEGAPSEVEAIRIKLAYNSFDKILTL